MHFQFQVQNSPNNEMKSEPYRNKLTHGQNSKRLSPIRSLNLLNKLAELPFNENSKLLRAQYSSINFVSNNYQLGKGMKGLSAGETWMALTNGGRGDGGQG